MDSDQQPIDDVFMPLYEWAAANGVIDQSSVPYRQSVQRVSDPVYNTPFALHMQEPLGSIESTNEDSPSMPSESEAPLGFRSELTAITNPFITQWTIADTSELLTAQLTFNPSQDTANYAEPALPQQPLQHLSQYPNVGHNLNALAGTVVNGWPSAADLIGGRRNRRARETATLLPWGLQRILTHEFVQDIAKKHGVPMPPIANTDVQLYCHFTTIHSDPRASTFPPFTVDLRFLGDIEVSAEELLIFFPDHLKWNDMIFRLAQNGWMPTDIARYINFTHGLQPPDHMRRNTASQYLRAADKVILGRQTGDKNFARPPWKTTCFTTKNWAPHEGRATTGNIDYFLVDLADGVVHFVEGTGARLLTRAVRHAITCGHNDVKLSQLRQYICENLLMFPPLPPMTEHLRSGQHPDHAAVLQFRDLVLEVKPE